MTPTDDADNDGAPDRPFPPHFPLRVSEFSTGRDVLLFVHVEERGTVSFTLPPDTTRVQLTRDQVDELAFRLTVVAAETGTAP